MNDIQTAQLIVIGIIVGLGLVLLALYWFLFARSHKVPVWKLKVQKRMQELNVMDIDKKLLLIEYDKLFEYALQQKFRRKESFGAILKSEWKKFNRQDLDLIWNAHKLRNNLVHNFEFKPEHSELNRSIIIFKRTISQFLAS